MARKRPAPPTPPVPVEDVYTRYNVFRPGDGGVRKHPCQDCAFCQFCSDSRCDQCLRQKRERGTDSSAGPGVRLVPPQEVPTTEVSGPIEIVQVTAIPRPASVPPGKTLRRKSAGSGSGKQSPKAPDQKDAAPPRISPAPEKSVPERLTPRKITRGTTFLKKADPVLGKLIRRVGPCRLEFEGLQSPFQALLEGIVYQQLTGKAAATIFGRVRSLLAPRGAIRPLDIVRATDEDLRACGLSGPKIAAIRDLAEKTQAGVVPDAAGLEAMTDEEVIRRLTAVRGIGRWTAEMLLVFRLGRPDVLSTGDYGLRKGFAALFHPDRLPTPKELGAYGERWHPFRSIASWYLWRASETFGNRKTK